MRAKTLSVMTFGLVLSLFIITPAHAGKKKAAPDAEMQANMAKVKEMGTPGPEHAVLNPLEGNWNVTSSHWMKPGAKVQKSTGSSSMAWVMGGRFLKQDYKGDMMGQPFEGQGYFGYDKVKKEYVSVWMDNMSTGLFEGSGSYDAATKTVTQSGTFSCPVAGPNRWFEWKWQIVSKDKNIFSMYMKDPAGKEFKGMEIIYTRAK
jgi:uncharacterized protein DUF1579